MLCPRCHAESPEGARFCPSCGEKLIAICPQCQAEAAPQVRFCPSCGSAMQAGSAEAQQQQSTAALAQAAQRLIPREYAQRLLATRGQPHDERRTVTILFCDVKGSTARAEKLDPEDVKEIMDGAFEVLSPPIFHYEGTLAQLMGDALLAFFGAPIAHEDDPERAVRAALEITAEARRYGEKLERERGIQGFSVRVGINTGLVVVGELGSDLQVEYTAVGDAINLAARMESAAEPGTVLITEATHRRIAPLFETQALGPSQLKGKAEPVLTYRVLAAKATAGKVRDIAGLGSPLVGRQAEYAALREAVERLKAGVGGIVTIVGEAGLGKSRLVAEVRRLSNVIARPYSAEAISPPPEGDCSSATAADAGVAGQTARNDGELQWVEGRCLAYGTAVAYLLWLDVMRDLLGVRAEPAPIRLREWVQDLCPQSANDVYPHLARLMSLPLKAEHEARLRGLEGEQLKAATFRAIETVLECAARVRPLVLVCEDLHWADPTSLELLERLLAVTDRSSLLILCVFRPDPEHGSWRLRETIARQYRHRHTNLWLNPLSSVETQTLVSNLFHSDHLPLKLREHLLNVTEGNPFYVEEVIRTLIDRQAMARDVATGQWIATQAVAEIAIPDTLQGVLLARIDRLQADARRLLQMAAVIGQTFLYRVLAAIASEERALDQDLLILQREEMIRERARIPELEYNFKHELTREAAYHGLLKKERRDFHRQVAQVLEELFPERVEEQLGLLAHHWERAEQVGKATEYLRRAGDQARLAYANEEAVAYYQRALVLLEPSSLKVPSVAGQPEEAARIHESLGDVLALAGRRDEARQAYGQAMSGAPDGDQVWRARLQRRIGTAWDEENRWQEATQAYAAAEAALGPEPPDSALGWWREWLEIQHRRIWLYYGLSRLDEMSALAEHTRPAVEKYATPLQRGEFFQGLVLLGLRKERYALSDETLAQARASVDAFRESGNANAVTLGVSGLGFALLWGGHLDEAEQQMLAALEQTERSGDVAVQSRCLTYLTILYRMRGQLDQVRHYAALSLALATERQMFEYIGMAKASNAWLAWREGSWAEAEVNGEAAVQMWQQAPLSTPFQWTARWPLLAVALAQNRVSDAMDDAQALLQPEQQRLPPGLTAQLEQAVAAWQQGDNAAAGVRLNQALELAQQLGFL